MAGFISPYQPSHSFRVNFTQSYSFTLTHPKYGLIVNALVENYEHIGTVHFLG